MLGYKWAKTKKPQTEEKTVPDDMIVSDPRSDEARALLGHYVLASESFAAFNTKDGGARSGLLRKIEPDSPKPFVVEAQDDSASTGVVGTRTDGYTFVKRNSDPALLYKPYDLSDQQARAKVIGRAVRHCATGNVSLVVYINKDRAYLGTGQAGMDSQTLYRDYRYLDGSPCGEKIGDGIA